MIINITGYIVQNEDKDMYDFFGLPSICPKDVQKKLASAGGAPVEVRVDSYGGSVWAGSTIYTELREYPGAVLIKVTGLAASAASIVCMAGRCLMSPTAQMMIHNASAQAEGDYHRMEETAEFLKISNESIAAAYTEKTGLPTADILELMDKEKWLTAKQAKDMGLVDGLLFDSAFSGPIDSAPLPSSAVCGYQRMREAYRQATSAASHGKQGTEAQSEAAPVQITLAAEAFARLNIEKHRFGG